jgi:hypothetical protein
MIDPGVGTPPGSYWGRYVPIAAALTVFGSLVMWLPGGQIVVPAVLSVQLLSRTEDSIQRYLPLIVAAAMVTALVPPFWILAVTAVAAGIVLESGIRRAVEWRVLSVATALPLFVGTGLPALLIDSATLEQQWRVMMEPFLGSGGEQLNEAVQWAFDLMLRLMPSLLVCGAVVSGLLALTAVTWWLRRQGSDPRVRVPGLAMCHLVRLHKARHPGLDARDVHRCDDRPGHRDAPGNSHGPSGPDGNMDSLPPPDGCGCGER